MSTMPLPTTSNDNNGIDTLAATSAADLPFLVTHWLSNYSSNNNNDAAAASEERREALEQIRRASSQLASAFATLGAYGTTIRPCLQSESVLQPHEPVRAQFPDVKRNWSSSCPPDHLQLLVQSALSAGNAAAATETPNLLLKAAERRQQQRLQTAAAGGRTLQDAIPVPDGSADAAHDESSSHQKKPAPVSVLQRPILLPPLQTETTASATNNAIISAASTTTTTVTAPSVTTTQRLALEAAADCMRQYLKLRDDKCRPDELQIQSIRRSLLYHQTALSQQQQQQRLEPQQHLEDWENQELQQNGHDRVIAQLQRQLTGLEQQHAADCRQLAHLQQAAQAAFARAHYVRAKFQQDPVILHSNRTSASNVLINLCSRQVAGMTRRRPTQQESLRRALGIRPQSLSSGVTTINTHLQYPVYCLQFDRTGRFFVSGADDYLVRVFGVRAKRAAAVLVCTLRGHAGVINNIDVSPDNSFLATASEDGDVRVWGLCDGSPIAILRGHKGGANTVMWSTTTPYRLVTAGGDGLARSWDIRLACLKRYGKVIGKRPEYNLKLPNGQSAASTTRAAARTSSASADFSTTNSQPIAADSSSAVSAAVVALPPLPMREPAAANGAQQQAQPPTNNHAIVVPLPPLPPAADGGGAAVQQQDDNHMVDAAAIGRFVANSAMDEGVKLVAKFQHGTLVEEQQQQQLGSSRSRRAPIKVLCVEWCPYGGHFATGSDDGICRIWREDADPRVELVDERFSCSMGGPVRSGPCHDGAGELLLTLKGHLSAITDLQYSHKGDRILSASQKDGVVRIWSWNIDPAAQTLGRRAKPSHILIKLSNPIAAEKKAAATTQTSRRRPNRAAAARISCDVAAWICDDSKVVTSQSELEKQSGSEIIPGSQYIFLWDSTTGDCLLGISNGHTRQCPVVIPHPTDPSIICSAGADGFAKLWDWSTGECVSSHQNTLEFGPIDPRDRGKPSGYLDGDFSPDGMNLVLADDSGRITVFDLYSSRDAEGSEKMAAGTASTWINEQYFSNDYYDLHYDQNGYCVERGSELPPHLAPRGVRCSHMGAPWSASVNEAFRGLIGPLPIAEDAARWSRQNARSMCATARERRFSNGGNLIGQFDPQTTILFTDSGELPGTSTAAANHASTVLARERARADNTRRMSSNYRWGDYEDDEGHDDEDAELDPDDEDYDINEGPGLVRQESSDSDEEMRDTHREAPTRVSSRQRHRSTFEENDSDSDDAELIEYMSTNNAPSGPFMADYESHSFRLTDSRSGSVARNWVRREESNSSYGGRKSYTPQVGDSVVYIPRAHYDTVQKYPSLHAPWQNWPEEAVWPVVRCNVRHIRYRFPFIAYSAGDNRVNSIVAILTLEITGIPELSSDRDFDWPKPSFVAPTRTHIFELSLFENDEVDYIIPIGLYTSRLKQVEDVLSGRVSDDQTEIQVYYAAENSIVDEWQAFNGRLVGVKSDADDDGGPHLSGSGYRAVSVVWSDDGRGDEVSPWEISLRNAPTEPDRLRLSEETKRDIREALKTLREMDEVEFFFFQPVNQGLYTDYASRIEVPMDLSFVTKRLESDYYSSEFSVVADVMLIRDNCFKYNGELDRISNLAQAMLRKFEELVLDEAALVSFRRFQEELAAGAQSSGEPRQPLAVSSAANNSSVSTVRRSSRQRQTGGSSLENLPFPAPAPSRQRRNSGPARRSGANRQNERRVRHNGAGARSILEPSHVARRTLEDLSTNGSSRGRRSTNRSGDGLAHRVLRSSAQQPEPQRPTRSSTDARAAANPNFDATLGRQSRYSMRRQGFAPRDMVGGDSEPQIPSRMQEGRTSSRSARSTRNSVSYADQPSDVEENETAGRPEAVRRRSRSAAEGNRERENEAGRQTEASSRAARATRQSRRSSPRPFASDSEENSTDREGHGQAGPGRRTTTGNAARQQSPGEEETLSSPSPRGPSVRLRTSSHQMSLNEEDGGAGQRRRTTSRAAARQHVLSRDEGTSSEERTPSPRGRNLRASGRRKTSRQMSSDEEDSDSDVSEEQLDDVSSEASEKAPAARRSSRARATAKRTDPGGYSSPEEGGNDRKRRRHSPRNRKTSLQSYEDPSSSEFGTDVEEKPPAKASRRQTARATGRACQKKKAGSPPSKKAKKTSDPGIDIDPWPDIDLKRISEVSEAILQHLRNVDEGDIFEAPVCEMYPDVADDYNAVVEQAMDFRTIEEERLPRYRSIVELQQDLVLVMTNCIAFNGENEFGMLARSMLDMLTDIFVQVCKDLKVGLPRGW